MQKPLTEKRLENITLYYLERFDASSDKVRQMLKRRIQKQKMLGIPVDKNINIWIENVIQKMQNLGYINDERYTENVIRRLSQGGKSTRFIQQKLVAEGISPTLVDNYLSADDELTRAQTFAHKKHLGHDYQKDLAKMARAGFPYEIAQQVLKGEDDV